MSIQHIFNEQAMDMVPISQAFINKTGEGYQYVLNKICNSYIPIAEMTAKQLMAFDKDLHESLKYIWRELV